MVVSEKAAEKLVVQLCEYLCAYPRDRRPEDPDWDDEREVDVLARRWSRLLLKAADVDWHGGFCPLCCA